MPTPLWRALALGCIAAALALVIGDLLHTTPVGTFGITARGGGGGAVVTSVAPGSPGSRAHIVPGDRISAAPGAENWYVFNAQTVAVGTPGTIDVSNAQGVRRVTLIAEKSPAGNIVSAGFLVTYEVLRIVMLAVALLIVLWRPQRTDARALATFFVGFAFGFVAGPPWHPWMLGAALIFLRPIAVFFGFQQALRFATIFPQRSTGGLRAHLDRLGIVILIATSALIVGGYLLPISPALTTIAWQGLTLAGFIALLLAIVVAFTLGYAQSSAADRPRMRWIAASLIVGVAGLLPTVILDQSGVASWWAFVPGLALVAIPIGVTYAMLRHRMFDIGFVVSRALVFAILSAIVVLAFSALEWLIGKSLLAAGHVQSVALEAALALGIGLSMDKLRGRVDHAVDNVFFRERHRAERALQRLSDECAYITSEDALVERTLDALRRYAQADGAALYFRDAAGGFRLRAATMSAASAIDENDPGVVSLRARRAPVDANDDESAPTRLPGIIAFPMLVRGELSGILCCASRNGEAYDPDERRLLAALASALASAFATIESVELRAGIDRALTGQVPIDALRELRLRFS